MNLKDASGETILTKTAKKKKHKAARNSNYPTYNVVNKEDKNIGQNKLT